MELKILKPETGILRDLSVAQDELTLVLQKSGLEPRTRLELDLATMTHANVTLALDAITTLTRALKAAMDDGADTLDTQFLLHYSFREMQLCTSPDFLKTIELDDLVEGYSLDHRQIFRNFQFMKICGYTLMDLLTNDWMTLYERANSIREEILSRCATVLETGRTVSLEDLPLHYMKESRSSTRQIVRMQFRNLGPIYKAASVPAGVMISCKATLVDEFPERHELRFI